MCSSCIFAGVTWAAIVLCGIPPELNNGTYLGPSKAISGSIYNYSCNEGFLPFGEFKDNLQVECLSNGSFSLNSKQLPTCIPVCPMKYGIENGRYNITKVIEPDYFIIGTEITYYCEDQFILVPQKNSIVTCVDGNRWTETPLCVPNCGSAPNLDNGAKSIVESIYVNDSLSLEMNVTYSCDFDLVLIPADQSQWSCLPGGNWSYSTPPQCLAECPWIYGTHHGNIVPRYEPVADKYLAGTIIDYVCEDYYVEKEGDNFSIVCQEDGTWNSTAIPRCILEWSDFRKCNVSYTFELTTERRNYTGSIELCKSMGGQLIHETLGFTEVGSTYFDEIEVYSNLSIPEEHYNSNYFYYVGINDLSHEGAFQFINKAKFDYTNSDIPQLLKWMEGEPNNIDDEDCIEIRGSSTLNDKDCERNIFALCEMKTIICV